MPRISVVVPGREPPSDRWHEAMSRQRVDNLEVLAGSDPADAVGDYLVLLRPEDEVVPLGLLMLLSSLDASCADIALGTGGTGRARSLRCRRHGPGPLPTSCPLSSSTPTCRRPCGGGPSGTRTCGVPKVDQARDQGVRGRDRVDIVAAPELILTFGDLCGVVVRLLRVGPHG